MTDLNELLERVKKATGPDQRIEVDLVHAFFDSKEATLHELHNLRMHEYTTSIDAALALVERVLPGWLWGVGNASDNAPNRFAAQVRRMGIIEMDHQYHFCPTAPLAILAALLHALNSGATNVQ